MGEKGIDEGAVGGAGAGVDHRSGGLINDDEVFVLKDNIQGNVLRHRGGRRWRRDGHFKGIARFDPVGGVSYGLAIEAHLAIKHKGLDAGAAQFVDLIGQNAV